MINPFADTFMTATRTNARTEPFWERHSFENRHGQLARPRLIAAPKAGQRRRWFGLFARRTERDPRDL